MLCTSELFPFRTLEMNESTLLCQAFTVTDGRIAQFGMEIDTVVAFSAASLVHGTECHEAPARFWMGEVAVTS